MPFLYPPSVKWLGQWQATAFQVHLWALMLVMIVAVPAQAAEAPLFRKTDTGSIISPLTAGTSLRLLADTDFPPFSFVAGNGQAAGLSVDLALLACAELKVTCTVEPRPFNELLPALQRKEGDVIVSGLKLDSKLLGSAAMTRPYFWSFGRFAVRKDAPLSEPDPEALASFKIAAVDGTGHAAFLKRHYGGSELVLLPTREAVLAALRKGDVQAVFGDNLALSFWLGGTDSAGCCKTLGGPLVDRSTFSHNLAYLVRREDASLLKAFDMALDRLQDNGATAKLLARYLPAGYW
jgi:polar amino acid transport system substrate-binding protein